MSRPLTWLGPADDDHQRSAGAVLAAAATRREPSPADDAPLVSLADISEIELLIVRRMKEFTIGEHSSLFHGSGFDFTGLREWQAGDRPESIDWPQSSLTNFSPLIVREFEQPSTSSVVLVADRSASTRCSVEGVPIAAVVARAIATIGMSAVFFQDAVGMVTFEDRFTHLTGVRPRIGKGQVIQCLDAYQRRASGSPTASAAEAAGTALRPAETLSGTLGGFMRKTSLVPVISDFLFEDAVEVMRELGRLNSLHDVVVAIVDAAFAFDMPGVSAGWVETYDVETGRSRVLSRRDARRMADGVRRWQDDVAALAGDAGLDVIRLAPDPQQFDIALMEFVVARRLRRKTS